MLGTNRKELESDLGQGMPASESSPSVSENIILTMLDKLVAGDFTPFEMQANSEVGRRIEALRVTLNGQLGLTKELAQALKIDLAEKSENYDALCSQAKEFAVAVDLKVPSQSLQSINNVVASTELLGANIAVIVERAVVSREGVAAVQTTSSELSSASQEIASNTDKARVISAKAVSDVRSATQQFKELESAAAEISNVTNTISEVSDQTKLLALNATIEAARAGDAGRGFAVVASEVKELASQTNDANRDIKSKIDIIQTAIGSTIESIMSVSTVISDVNEIVSTIAAAAEQQSLATADISKNVSSTAESIASMSSAVVNSEDAVGELKVNLSEVDQGFGGIVDELSRISTGHKSVLGAVSGGRDGILGLVAKGDDLINQVDTFVLRPTT